MATLDGKNAWHPSPDGCFDSAWAFCKIRPVPISRMAARSHGRSNACIRTHPCRNDGESRSLSRRPPTAHFLLSVLGTHTQHSRSLGLLWHSCCCRGFHAFLGGISGARCKGTQESPRLLNYEFHRLHDACPGGFRNKLR